MLNNEAKIRLNNIKSSIEHDGSDHSADCMKFVIDLLHAEQEENARLRAVIDEANAQEPWCLVDDGQMFFNDQDMIDHFDGGYFDKSTFTKLYTNPIPAQQSPAVAVPKINPMECQEGVYKNGVSVGLFDMRKEYADELCSRLTELTEYRYDWHYIAGRVHIKMLMKVKVENRDSASQSPRITEQDAREIYRSINHKAYMGVSFTQWLDDEGRALLEKLNVDKPEILQNQCDGCVSGQKVNNFGMHYDGDGRATILCQKGRYKSVWG